MAENKKSFLLYTDLIHTVRKMPEDKAGKLLLTILQYVNDENPVVDDMVVDLVFEPIKQQFKRDLVKYNNIVNRNTANGKLGGRPKKPQKPTGLIGNPKKPKKPDSVNDTVNDNDSVIKDSIEVRKKIFATRAKVYLGKYDAGLLNDFYLYWTEHGLNDKKMRFEKQTSFSMERRLSTWKKNETKFNEKNRTNNNKDFTSDTTKAAIESVRNGFVPYTPGT